VREARNRRIWSGGVGGTHVEAQQLGARRAVLVLEQELHDVVARGSGTITLETS
jgi:hypothetical protein